MLQTEKNIFQNIEIVSNLPKYILKTHGLHCFVKDCCCEKSTLGEKLGFSFKLETLPE